MFQAKHTQQHSFAKQIKNLKNKQQASKPERAEILLDQKTGFGEISLIPQNQPLLLLQLLESV